MYLINHVLFPLGSWSWITWSEVAGAGIETEICDVHWGAERWVEQNLYARFALRAFDFAVDEAGGAEKKVEIEVCVCAEEYQSADGDSVSAIRTLIHSKSIAKASSSARKIVAKTIY